MTASPEKFLRNRRRERREPPPPPPENVRRLPFFCTEGITGLTTAAGLEGGLAALPVERARDGRPADRPETVAPPAARDIRPRQGLRESRAPSAAQKCAAAQHHAHLHVVFVFGRPGLELFISGREGDERRAASRSTAE